MIQITYSRIEFNVTTNQYEGVRYKFNCVSSSHYTARKKLLNEYPDAVIIASSYFAYSSAGI